MQQFTEVQTRKHQLRCPPWKTGAAFPSCPLLRAFPRGSWNAEAGSKVGSTTTAGFRELAEGPETSNWRGNLTGLRDTSFFPFPGEEWCQLGLATLRDGATMGTYSTRPSSTTVDMRTPYCEENSPDDGHIAPRAYHCSLVSLRIRRQSSAFSKHVFKSPKNDPMSRSQLLTTWFTRSC